MGIIRPYRNREEVYCGRLVVFHNSPNSWKLSKSIPGTDNQWSFINDVTLRGQGAPDWYDDV